MLRVSHIDSGALDAEIYNILWNKFKTIIPLTRNKPEWKLFIETLIFVFSTQYSQLGGGITTTYGSQLSNLGFRGRKSSMYILMVLKRYINERLANHYLDSPLYKKIMTLFNILDLINLTHFIRNHGTIYYSILQRILRIEPMSLDTGSSFYENTIYSGLEYENRQLLWNTILELLNSTILPNTIQYFHYFQLQNSHTEDNNNNKRNKDNKLCCRCNEFPTNPYRIMCCDGIYCYLCLLKSIEWKHCYNCNETKGLKGISYFA